MSTAPLAHPGPRAVAAPHADARHGAERAPRALAVALLLAIAYAAFAHGAASFPDEPRLQVALAAVAALAAGAWLWTGSLRLAAPALGVVGAGLLAAFAAWSAITLAWSVAPDQTWVEFNRTLTYLLVLCLALALGASYARAVETVASGYLVVATVVAAYALGQKLLPGLHISGLFNLDHPGRLQEPFGYWNALALFVAMAIPIALALVVDDHRRRRTRLRALITLEVLLLTLGLTESRGAAGALVLGLALGITLSGERLRSLVWLALAIAAMVPGLVFGLSEHALTSTTASLGDREGAGLLLALIVAVSVVALVGVARRVFAREELLYLSPAESRRIGVRVAAVVGVVVVAAVLAAAFAGAISWHSFTTTHTASGRGTAGVLSADSQNRWVWWKEAAGAFGDRPLGGWGAGSFGVVHLLYRRDSLSVASAHSAPLQWLAETGVVGAVLAVGAVGLLLASAVAVTRRSVDRRERLLMAALVAAVITYAVQALYDWGWEIPGVTLPAVVFLGVLSGAAVARAPSAGGPRGRRVLALGAVTVGLCSFALSATLPSLAASKARSALVAASDGAVASAARTAALASSLDPLSDAGPLAQATIASRQGRPALARAYLLDAIRREPSDPAAWRQLATVELDELGDLPAARLAARRLLALDPLDPVVAFAILARANAVPAHPAGSATATPLPPGFTGQTRAAAHR